MRRFGSFKLLVVGMAVALFAGGCLPVLAASSNLSQSYQVVGKVPNGSLVSLVPGQSGAVEASNSSNGGRLLGVVVVSNDSLLATNPNAAPADVQVATAGSATILVSTLNGDIGVGDQIGVSSFNGIGIKALPGSRVIGIAQTAFTNQTAGATSESATDKSGQLSTITVGYAEVSIAIGTNASAAAASESGLNGLQKAAKTLTGHTVSTFRVIIGLAVAIIASLALITLIYASIYGSIISIGRNPLARFDILQTLSIVLGLALVTAFVAGLTVFLLLT